MKEIHFYESQRGRSPCTTGSWKETEELIRQGARFIQTYQMGLLGMCLIESGYQVFIHERDGETYELRLGNCDRTEKEIRPAHNLFRMWQAGAFSRKQ